MAAKRSIQRSSHKSKVPMPAWRQGLVLLALMPAALGILLIVCAGFDFLVWDTVREQVAMGGFYILLTFALSNAVQKDWKLAAGWITVGVAAWLALNRPEMEAKVAAAVLIGLAVALLTAEFLRRRRQYLSEKKG